MSVPSRYVSLQKNIEEMDTVLNTGCEARKQEQRTNAIATGENQRLQEELDR